MDEDVVRARQPGRTAFASVSSTVTSTCVPVQGAIPCLKGAGSLRRGIGRRDLCDGKRERLSSRRGRLLP